MAKKMLLVEPRMLNALKYDEPPTTNILLDLDEQMRQILNNREMSVGQKVDMYNQTLQKHSTFLEQRRNPNPATLPQLPTPPTTDSTPTTADPVFEDVIKSLPKTYQRKGRLLMERLQRHPNMTWNDQGELVIKGNTLPGTNVIDLVNDVMRQRRKFAPRGWEEFAGELRETNVPQDLIGHPERWAYIQKGATRLTEPYVQPGAHSSRWSQWHQ